MELECNHISYLCQPNINDTNNARLWFIAKQLPNNDYTFSEAENLSIYWQNKQHLKCTYSAPIEKKIREAELQLFVTN